MRWKRTCCSVDLFSRKCSTKASWPMGTPRTFKPCWTGGNKGSPRHHCAWLHRSSSSGQNLHATRLRAPSIPHLRLPMVQMDSSMGPQLLLHGNMCPIHSRRARRRVNVVQVARTRTPPAPNLACVAMLSEGEQYGHEGIALLPSLPLWNAVSDPPSHLPTNMWMGSRRNISQRGGSDLLPPSVTGPQASRCGEIRSYAPTRLKHTRNSTESSSNCSAG